MFNFWKYAKGAAAARAEICHFWRLKTSPIQRYSELRTSDRFDDPLAYPGFGLGENMIFPKYELKLYFLEEHNF